MHGVSAGTTEPTATAGTAVGATTAGPTGRAVRAAAVRELPVKASEEAWTPEELAEVRSELMAEVDRLTRQLDVAFRPADEAVDEGAPAGPAPLRKAGGPGADRLIRVVISRGAYSRTDVLWASRQGGVHLVDVRDPAAPEHLSTLEPENGSFHSVAFSPDGSTLAAGAGDGTVLRWPLTLRRGLPTCRSVRAQRQRRTGRGGV